MQNTAKDSVQQHRQLSSTKTHKNEPHQQTTKLGEEESKVSSRNVTGSHASLVRCTVTMAGGQEKVNKSNEDARLCTKYFLESVDSDGPYSNMQTKQINNYKILDENDDFYLTKEGSLWALLPKQDETSKAICVKPKDNIKHASFDHELLTLDGKSFHIKLASKGVRYEEIVDEHEHFFLTKRKGNWSLLCKKTNKTKELSKLKNATKVNFAGSVLMADKTIFYLNKSADGEVILNEHETEDSESSDDNAENQTGTKTDEKPKTGEKQNSNHSMDDKAVEQGVQEQMIKFDSGNFKFYIQKQL